MPNSKPNKLDNTEDPPMKNSNKVEDLKEALLDEKDIK